MGKIELSTQKSVRKAGKEFQVAELNLIDNSGGQIKVSVWDRAYDTVEAIPYGEGMTCIGCTATREGDQVKLNVWPSGHVLRGGARAQSLTSLDASKLETTLLTATFAPTHTSISTDGQEAHPTCASALREALGPAVDKNFQLNRCFVEAPTRAESLHTQDGRLFVHCRLHDRTGCVEVDVLSQAVPELYGCADECEVEEHIKKGTLEPLKVHVNARGVLRSENGVVKRYIAQVAPSPLKSMVSSAAMRMALGLTEINGDLVIPAPVERIVEIPMVGLAVRSDRREPLGCRRVLILVQGTGGSTLDALGNGKSLQEESYKVFSPKVRCLLSSSEQYVDLVGYCDFNGMLQYRLDKDSALVLISAITIATPDSVSVGSSIFTATIDHVQKVTTDELSILRVALETEWKSVLLDGKVEGVSATDDTYWEQPATKIEAP